jgi:hypothetical protein
MKKRYPLAICLISTLLFSTAQAQELSSFATDTPTAATLNFHNNSISGLYSLQIDDGSNSQQPLTLSKTGTGSLYIPEKQDSHVITHWQASDGILSFMEENHLGKIRHWQISLVSGATENSKVNIKLSNADGSETSYFGKLQQVL